MGDSPANYVDPSGMKECAAGGCWYHKGPPAPPTGAGGPGPSPSAGFSWDRCGLDITMFFVSLGFDILGVAVGKYMKVGEQIAWSMFTTWQWGTITTSIFSNLWEFLDTAISVLWFIITNIIPNLDWSDGLIAGLKAAMAATGAGLLADLIGLGIGAGVGLIQLGMKNCL